MKLFLLAFEWVEQWVDHFGTLLLIRDPELHDTFCLRCSR